MCDDTPDEERVDGDGIVPEADGSMWVGTEGDGVYRFINGGFDHLDGSKGLLGKVVHALYLDADGALWIGTADAGLSRWRNGRSWTVSSVSAWRRTASGGTCRRVK